MAATNNKHEVFGRFDDASLFWGQVVRASNAQINELPFFPISVFLDSAHRARLLMGMTSTPSGRIYSGHLLFLPQYRRAHVMQILTLPKFKKRGLASLLMSTCGPS